MNAHGLPVVAVVWRDPNFEFEANVMEDILDSTPVVTYGLLVQEAPHLISVAHEVFPDADGNFTDARGVTTIPAQCVTSIHYFEENPDRAEHIGVVITRGTPREA